MNSVQEIPMSLIKVNQLGIVLFVAAGLLLQAPVLVLLLWGIQAAGLLLGMRGNLFVQLYKALVRNRQDRPRSQETQARELTRFNNSIAALLLTAAGVCFLLDWHVAGYVAAGMVGLAAFIALCGYCIGCTLYYQFKRLRHASRG